MTPIHISKSALAASTSIFAVLIIDSTVQAAAIAAIAGIISAALMKWLTGRSEANIILAAAEAKRKEKAEDYKRQDEVAAKAEEAAKLLLESNRIVAEASKVQNVKLDQIHLLVNSNLTAALESKLAAYKGSLATLDEMAAIRASNGKPPSEKTTGQIADIKLKIHETEAELADRLAQTKKSDAIILAAQNKTILSDGKS